MAREKKLMGFNNKYQGKVLIVDDDKTTLRLFEALLYKENFLPYLAENIETLFSYIKKETFDAILLDVFLGKDNGISAISNILANSPSTKIIVMTSNGSIDAAVEAMEKGATTFVTKSTEPQKIIEEIKRRLISDKISTEFSENIGKELGIIGKSEEIQKVIKNILILKDVDSTVLITGESGTGKEIVAKAIHKLSRRCSYPFEAINCGAIPENLLESELFGYKKGAFTDAKSDKKGSFENCKGGTLFLDEISEMPFPLQVKLLRVLQENEVKPIGANYSVKIDTRILASTNKNLKDLVEHGEFRRDLYYRLNVVPIYIPPLRQRKIDIPILISHFLEVYNKKFGKKVRIPTPSSIAKLSLYDWPGNIRELQNSIQRAVILSTDNEFHLEHVFPKKEDSLDIYSFPLEYSRAKMEFEKTFLEKILRFSKGNVSKAARFAGKFRSDIYRLMARYGMDRSQFKEN